MHRGRKFLSAVAIVALAGCDGEAAKLTIRSMPAPVSAVAKPVPLRIAEARGQLALGNVALALGLTAVAALPEFFISKSFPSASPGVARLPRVLQPNELHIILDDSTESTV